MIKYSAPVKKNFLLTINPVIRFMILSDFVWMGSLGLLSPIFAIFIEDNIVGGNAAVAGAAAAIYLITKSIFQIPVATMIDKVKGEKDDFWVLFTASLFTALMPIAYLYIALPWQLYLVQFMYGLLAAFTFPSFVAIFTRHVDRHKEGTEWGVYYTLVDLGSAFAAFVGGIVVTYFGFNKLIMAIVVLNFIGVFFLYPIKIIAQKK